MKYFHASMAALLTLVICLAGTGLYLWILSFTETFLGSGVVITLMAISLVVDFFFTTYLLVYVFRAVVELCEAIDKEITYEKA